MKQNYDHKEVEPRIALVWEKGNYFSPIIDRTKKPFSIFLTPPNASGGMHIGNVLMIALQDILARHYRAKGRPTLWIPSTDHGGYETQVTFERELEKEGKNRFDYTRNQLVTKIGQFVDTNNELIKKQIKGMGASVDWSRFRFTLDDISQKATREMFEKMVSDNLIYRDFYMVNYCASCGTMLADIELKEEQKNLPLYFIKFYFEKSEEYLSLATSRPEFLFATTEVMISPADAKHKHLIGKTLRNPITGAPVHIITSKRKFDPATAKLYLSPFSPSYFKYDYEYAIRNSISAKNLLDWNGNMIERYPGLKPSDAREKEVSFLKEGGFLEKADDSHQDSIFLCKSGHIVESMILQTWFVKLDDEKKSLKKPALEALQKGSIKILPHWREKGLTGWIEKMHDWPIGRQNVWGIKIPIWYDISDPSLFMVWFVNKAGKKIQGNLKKLLEDGTSVGEISEGIERIYASEGAPWVLKQEPGKLYLPETDTFDTWYSSGDWSTMVFGSPDSPNFSYFYPSDSILLGYDLLRLCVSREIFLSLYMTGKLPFQIVYFHNLILGNDGQKMSKSLGNAVQPDYYLEKFGVDVTRMTLTSYTALPNDFIVTEERLLDFKNFRDRLWNMGQIIAEVSPYISEFSSSQSFSERDRHLFFSFDRLVSTIDFQLEKYQFAFAQEKLIQFLGDLERYFSVIKTEGNTAVTFSLLHHIFGKYLMLLHPFMPFMTEELYGTLYNPSSSLAAAKWPDKR